MMEGIQQTIFNRVSSFKQSGGKLKSSEQYKMRGIQQTFSSELLIHDKQPLD
jgi:hypothetical protein